MPNKILLTLLLIISFLNSNQYNYQFDEDETSKTDLETQYLNGDIPKSKNQIREKKRLRESLNGYRDRDIERNIDDSRMEEDLVNQYSNFTETQERRRVSVRQRDSDRDRYEYNRVNEKRYVDRFSNYKIDKNAKTKREWLKEEAKRRNYKTQSYQKQVTKNKRVVSKKRVKKQLRKDYRFSDTNHLNSINKKEFAKEKLEKKMYKNLMAKIPRGSKIKAVVDLSSQRMSIYANNKQIYKWKVSTGKGRRYATPRGSYKPQILKKMHYSKKYHNSPMPHSVFFRGGYAIHGTNSISRLGKRASHGCVRLHPSNAKKLFALIKKQGKRNVKIVVR